MKVQILMVSTYIWINVWKTDFRIFLIFVLLFPTTSLAFQSNNPEAIQLRVIPLELIPKEFYIAGIIDQRKETSVAAHLIPATGGLNTVPVDLKGGTMVSLENFMQKSIPQNRSLRPVIVKIRKCLITEKWLDRGIVEGQVELDFSFELFRKDGNVHLLDFDGGIRYKRSVRQFSVIEPSLRRSLANSLHYFHNWMEKEAPNRVEMAIGVKILTNDYTQNMDNDTVFYDRSRPIRWSDFKARPRPGNYAASIFTSFSYEGNSEIRGGYLHIELELKVFMLKQSSWVRDGHRDDYGLNHEQRHFDITKLVVERFKEKILSLDVYPEDYDSALSYQYLEAFREMNRLQDEYDRETGNGRNREAQYRWDKKIEEELNAVI